MKFLKSIKKKQLTLKCSECDALYNLSIKLPIIKIDYCSHVHCFECGSPIYFYLTDNEMEEV